MFGKKIGLLMKISLCIITLNEEANLQRCLMSASLLVDEIIIVDSGSVDGTRKIAQKFSARWIEREWLGYVEQKNYTLAQASHDWILCLDADEALSPHLLSEMLCLKHELELPRDINGFSVPRCVFYDGRWIKNGDWYPDRLVRLFRNGTSQFEGGKVHERLNHIGGILKLHGDLEHYSFQNEEDHRAGIE